MFSGKLAKVSDIAKVQQGCAIVWTNKAISYSGPFGEQPRCRVSGLVKPEEDGAKVSVDKAISYICQFGEQPGFRL